MVEEGGRVWPVQSLEICRGIQSEGALEIDICRGVSWIYFWIHPLKGGVEKTLVDQLPELAGVRDITDHSIRDNAYYT